jgi:hypothetical protein
MASDSDVKVTGPGRDVWLADFNRAAEAVRPFVKEDSEGFKYVSRDCPALLAGLYSDLAGIGYFYGYLRA